MADEDEIDILGDFSLDNLFSKDDSEIYDSPALESQNSDVLNCDCPSPWLLDHTSTVNPTCWYTNGHSDFCTDLAQEQPQNDIEPDPIENQISTENAITDESGWTKKEKNLLERGIEIFGRSNVRLAQFIGTKMASEVKYYLKHYYVNSVQSCESISEEPIIDGSVIEETVVTSDIIEHPCDDNEVLDDSEIPASIEEVIAAVSTAQPTVQVSPKKARKSSGSRFNIEFDFKNIPSGHSLLKSNIYKQIDHYNGGTKRSRETSVKRKETRSPDRTKKLNRKNCNEVKFKFSTKMKLSEQSKIKVKRKESKREEIALPEINEIKPKMEIQKISPNLNGGEVVKIKKEDSNTDVESDLEIDVENIVDEEDVKVEKSPKKEESAPVKSDNADFCNEISNNAKEAANAERKLAPKDLSDVSEEVMKQLMSMEHPTAELILAQDSITELEKCVNGEFFEGRPTKTPNRYLKIRNHIVNAWLQSKPSYVTKTSIRPGLKNCGDVNCIGRIHQFLEQIGAINFGCAQTVYVRPLHDMLMMNAPAPKEKAHKVTNMVIARPVSLTRPRIKKKFTNDGEGGCTLTHDEWGEVINTTVVNEEPVLKQRPYIKKPSVRLIYCKPFTENNPQQYKIHLDLPALLLMDLHAHMSHSEVMGLIGGYWNPQGKTLTITHYMPCRNIAPSATHCDMCPISQAKAADAIHSEGRNILGWFHTHPTFAPEPSQQDLDTQLSVQQWIGINKPCIGLILSPFSAHGALIASPYRCLIVDKKLNFEDLYVPYKFKVELLSSLLDVNRLLSHAWRIFNTDSNVSAAERVDFNKPYFLDRSISYMDKVSCIYDRYD